MKLPHRRCGDYCLPNIGIPAEDMHPLDKHGRMRLRSLRQHRAFLSNQLLRSVKLMKATDNVAEELKAADQIE